MIIKNEKETIFLTSRDYRVKINDRDIQLGHNESRNEMIIMFQLEEVIYYQ